MGGHYRHDSWYRRAFIEAMQVRVSIGAYTSDIGVMQELEKKYTCTMSCSFTLVKEVSPLLGRVSCFLSPALTEFSLIKQLYYKTIELT